MEALGEYMSVQYNRSLIQERNRKISILLDISNFLASSLRLERILDGALSRVLDHFGFEGGRIYLMDEEGGHLTLAAYSGIEPIGLETVDLDEGFSGKAARTRSFLAGRVRDLEDRQRVRLLLGKGYEMIVCVPLVALDKVVGVMNLTTDRVIELDRGKIDLLMIVGNQIDTAANNALLYEEVQGKVKELKELFDSKQSYLPRTKQLFVCMLDSYNLVPRVRARYLPPQTLHNNPDLLFCAEFSPCCPSDLPNYIRRSHT